MLFRSHVIRRSLSYRLQDILRGWVHRLTAAYYAVGSEVAEQRLDTRARRNCNESEVLLGLHGNLAVLLDSLVCLDDIVMLLAHVLYLHLGQLAELYALLDRLAGVVGVNVHLDDVIVVDHYNAVADGLEERAQRCRVLCAGLLVYDKLGAVREFDIQIGRASCRERV